MNGKLCTKKMCYSFILLFSLIFFNSSEWSCSNFLTNITNGLNIFSYLTLEFLSYLPIELSVLIIFYYWGNWATRFNDFTITETIRFRLFKPIHFYLFILLSLCRSSCFCFLFCFKLSHLCSMHLSFRWSSWYRWSSRNCWWWSESWWASLVHWFIIWLWGFLFFFLTVTSKIFNICLISRAFLYCSYWFIHFGILY